VFCGVSKWLVLRNVGSLSLPTAIVVLVLGMRSQTSKFGHQRKMGLAWRISLNKFSTFFFSISAKVHRVF